MKKPLSEIRALVNTRIPDDHTWEPYIRAYESLPSGIESELFQKTWIEDDLLGDGEFIYSITSERAQAIRDFFWVVKCNFHAVSNWLRFFLDNRAECIPQRESLDYAAESLALLAKARLNLCQGLYLHLDTAEQLWDDPRAASFFKHLWDDHDPGSAWIEWCYCADYFHFESIFSGAELSLFDGTGKVEAHKARRAVAEAEEYAQGIVGADPLEIESQERLASILKILSDYDYSSLPLDFRDLLVPDAVMMLIPMTAKKLALSSQEFDKGYWKPFTTARRVHDNKARRSALYQAHGIVNDKLVVGSRSHQMGATRNRDKKGFG